MIALALRRQRAALATVGGVVVLSALGLVVLVAGGYEFQGPPQLAVFCMPLLIGLVTGTTLFAREFDDGAHVFTLTQSARRSAWWTSTVAVAAIATALAAGAMSLIAGLMATGLTSHRTEFSLLYPPWFETTGTAAIAYALLAFAVSSTVGFLTRSTLAAVVTALIVYIVVMVVLNQQRVGQLPAEAVSTPLETFPEDVVPPGGRTVSFEYVDSTGRWVGYDELSRICQDDWDRTCLDRAGVVSQLVRYLPASSYWPLQLIETGILLALSALVVAAGRIGLKRATRP